MAYCTATEVASEFKDIEFNASSVIKPEAVESFILQADAEIDSRIGVRYLTPVPQNTTAGLICKTMSIAIVVHRINQILAVKTGDSKTEQDGSRMSLKDARKMMTDIGAGLIRFDGATPRSVDDGISGNPTEGEYEPTFKIKRDDW